MGASQDLALKVLLQASDQTGGTMKGFGSSLATFLANPAKAAGLGMVALGAAVVGVGIKATQMAADYDQHMRMVQGLTGSSNKEMQGYDTSLKALAIDAGVGPTKLTDGLYNVLSASIKGKDAVTALTLATEDSVIGMTNAGVTTNALTTLIKGFSVQSKDYTKTNGEMITTVTLGKMTMADYAGAIGKAASTSMQFHVSMENMNASIATMTSNGIPSARQATTDYNQSLGVMYSSINTVSKSLNKQGVAFNETKFNTLDYTGKIKMMNTALVEANDKHLKITGVTKQAAQAIQVLSQHSKEYSSDLATLSNKQAMNQATANAWAVTQGGLNQTMNRLHASIDVVMISIGQKLLPVVTTFAQKLMPLIAQLGTWLVKSGFLDKAAAVLGVVLGGLITAIVSVATNGAAFINFLNQGSIAATGVKIILGLLLGGVLGFVAAGIPALVIGFIAWATAAGAAAIATIAAAAPFILIGIAIAAVVIIIILAVQHWGAIVSFLRGAWAAFAAWFMSALHAVGAFFVNVWNGIVEGLKRAWAFIIQVVKIGALVLLAIMFAPIIAIAALFIWLYAHNIYFQRLVDAIISIVKAGVAWLIGAWQNTITWIVGAWDFLKTKAEEAFSFVYNIISTKLNQVKAFITTVLTAIGSFFTTAWNNDVKLVTQLWQKIAQIFSSAWSAFIQSPLGQLLSNIVSFFQKLPGMALTWGENLIKGFISGIMNMAGGVGNAVSSIASKVSGFLGFHSPAKEGPGSTAHQWAPNLMKMFTSGLQDGLPALKATVNLLALQLANLTNPQKTALAIKAGIQNGVSGSGVSVAPGSGASGGNGPGGFPGGNGGGGVMNFYITINAAKATAKDVAAEVITIIDKKYKRSGNHVTVTSGGKA